MPWLWLLLVVEGRVEGGWRQLGVALGWLEMGRLISPRHAAAVPVPFAAIRRTEIFGPVCRDLIFCSWGGWEAGTSRSFVTMLFGRRVARAVGSCGVPSRALVRRGVGVEAGAHRTAHDGFPIVG